ncbi:MAG TPA: hypothetical protein VNS62_06710 [Candidatus Udaeobacter sp.]|nr:hypothetical protein [Candidatus Udaeobacter sp.]
MYEPGPGNQINDFNPGIAPSGLFWTTAISPEDVDVDFEEGSASMRVHKVAVTDFHDIGNALFGGGAPPTPAIVTFHVRWSGVQERLRIRNVDQDFTGKFIRNQAQMEWSATTEEFSFASAPANSSSSSFAELGHMRNGSFFKSE